MFVLTEHYYHPHNLHFVFLADFIIVLFTDFGNCFWLFDLHEKGWCKWFLYQNV